MIQQADSHAPHAPCLADYVDGLFAPRDQAERLNENAVREVASALETYARLECDEIIDTEKLAFLASSAVHALGRDDLAVEAVIMGTGAVYSQQLESAGPDIVWVINTEKLFPDITNCTELAFFSVVYHLVGNMVHLWDKTRGRGVLGLKRLREVSGVFAGGNRAASSTQWVEHIIGSVEDRLAQCSVDRDWDTLPRVMMLD